MKVIKKINNNVAVAIDGNGEELVIFGKGVGFPATPYELSDLSKIEKSYYGISKEYTGLLVDINKEIFDIASAIMNYTSSQIDCAFNPNVVFTLADHINFAVERYRKNIYVKTPFVGDLKLLYEKEYNVGRKAVAYINRVLGIQLPKDEANSIALHIINSENIVDSPKDDLDEDMMTEHILEIIRQYVGEIDPNGFNCTRFVTHLRYLYKRIGTGEILKTGNESLLKSMMNEYPDYYECAKKIQNYLNSVTTVELSEEELVYLIIHINRLAVREVKGSN